MPHSDENCYTFILSLLENAMLVDETKELKISALMAS
jgi:hypothetical protein